ncbi:hypothetical protein C8J56DRAFT_1162664 [Mycena floridula]|nr:hypothetical protein C8J56DRAFT_1162664 [Mycena floridula]
MSSAILCSASRQPSCSSHSMLPRCSFAIDSPRIHSTSSNIRQTLPVPSLFKICQSKLTQSITILGQQPKLGPNELERTLSSRTDRKGFIISMSTKLKTTSAIGQTRCARGYMPAANDKLFGRDQEIEDIVRILTAKPSSSQSKLARFSQVFTTKPVSSLKCAHLALLGAGGQGKTATALKVMAHPAMKQFYSRKNSLWVPCDEATSPELFLDVLYNSLALTSKTHNTLEAILHELQQTSKPIILLLDNFETPWNAPGARGTVARILQDIAQFPHVALFVTIIQALDPAAAHQLFISIHPESQEDSKLSELLNMLGHMALAVKLMARYGKNTGQKAGQLISGYQSTGTSMLGSMQGSDRQNSVSVSICMSLESSLVKNELNAAQLLQIIAMLPSGASPETLQQWWAENLENLNGALRVLLEASLLEQRTTTYFVLPVIRSYLLDGSHFSNNIHDSLVKAACNFLEQYNSTTPGAESFHKDMQTSEPNIDVIKALHILAWHQYRIRPRIEVIQHAVKLLENVTDLNQLVGHVFHSYASILYTLGQYQGALKQFNLAQDAYLAASEPTLAAKALINIANVSAVDDSSFNEIPLLEKAQQELESLDEDNEQWQQAMTRCLILLGEAHSRWFHHSKALENLIRARDFCSDLPLERAQCADRLADAHHHLQQLDEAEKWALLAVSEWKHIQGYLGGSFWLLGRIYISKAEYDGAMRSLEEGLQCAKTYGLQQDAGHILLELGRAHMKQGKDSDAKKSLGEALMNYEKLEGMEREKIVCQYYLDKLKDSSRVPSSEQEDALLATQHGEDIPGHDIVVSSTV